jgi:HEAT repeat protein
LDSHITVTPTEPHSDMLVATLLTDADPARRAKAADLLTPFVQKRINAALRVALDDDDERVRKAALLALVSQGDKRACAEVEADLESEDEEEIVRAAVTLGRARSVESVPALLKAFRTKNAAVAEAVAEALGETGDRIAAPLLCLALEHRFVPVTAADSLGRIGDERAIAPLLRALEVSRDGELRAAAARALGRIRRVRKKRHVSTPQVLLEGRVIPALRKALEDSDKRVRINAAVALWQLGDKNCGRQAIAELST